MKRTHIIGIVIIAVAVFVIISTMGNASQYVTFDKAQTMAQNGQTSKIHVVGHLKKDEQGNIVGLEPSQDKLSLNFLMVDNQGNTQKVFYNEPMPSDFTRSDQVVVIGNYHNDTFVADKILMKCPSKYQETEVK